ncbi:MAG: vitamin K epoxide reductase family protein [Fimbriimonadaceae bacterium]|nr:vitamin K epoxide reductase family protein [Fimbriimonadaceae bacterium]QYK57084.1 MAG: vitamin K epoxide reductase family protein [Fimbriimonadaceae bacterium]
MSTVTEAGAVKASGSAAMVNRVVAFLSWAGVFVAGALSFSHVFGKSLPCGTTGGCDTVAMHPTAAWFGVPVALVGLIGYLLLAGLAAARSFGPPNMWKPLSQAGLVVASFGFMASMYFVYTSIAVIQATCLWCLASAGIMTAIFFATLVMSQMPVPEGRGGRQDMMATAGGMILALGSLGGYSAYLNAKAEDIVKGVNLQGITIEELLPGESRMKGTADAPVTIIEFADVNCPACRRAAPVIEQIFREGKGRIRIAFRHVPLVEHAGHETSMHAAVAAEYAAKSGKFWQYLGACFSEANEFRVKSPEGLIQIATEMGLDEEGVRAAMQSDSPEATSVVADLNLSKQIDLGGTPTFIVLAKGAEPKVVTISRLEALLKEEPYLSLIEGK